MKLKSIFLPDERFQGVSEEVAALVKPLLQKHELGKEKDGGKVGGKKGWKKDCWLFEFWLKFYFDCLYFSWQVQQRKILSNIFDKIKYLK